MKKMNRNEYISALKMVIESEDLEIMNTANHMALEYGVISLGTFQAAASLLVEEYKRRNW